MANSGIIRRIDDLGRIVIPKDFRRACAIKDGDAMEINIGKKGEIIIRPYRKSFEQCALDWYNKNQHLFEDCSFRFDSDDYTFCVIRGNRYHNFVSRAGFAKRYKDDPFDARIGHVAAYANALGRNLNKMIGYEG